jgi:ankyrin repeat protein
VVEMLLSKGAKVNIKNDGGLTPLHIGIIFFEFN